VTWHSLVDKFLQNIGTCLSTTQYCIPEDQNLMYCTSKKLAIVCDNREFFDTEDVDYGPQNMTPHSVVLGGYQYLIQTCCVQRVGMCNSGQSSIFLEGISKHALSLMDTSVMCLTPCVIRQLTGEK
jgi:hypothetical protein